MGSDLLQAFQDLLNLVTPHASNLQYWRGSQSHVDRPETPSAKSGPARKLGIEEELVMTLMKLRMGIINELLGDMFVVFLHHGLMSLSFFSYCYLSLLMSSKSVESLSKSNKLHFLNEFR